MKPIKSLFVFLICFGIIVQGKNFDDNYKFCELERKFCKTIPHVGCNQSKKFDGTLIKINDNIKTKLITKLNSFRNELASGIISAHAAASKMRILEWSTDLEKVANLLLHTSKHENEYFCTATSSSPYTAQVTFKSSYPYNEIQQHDITELFDQLLMKFTQENLNINSIVKDSATEIGCVVGHERTSANLKISCVLNIDPTENYLYETGSSCSMCHSIGGTCDLKYKSLCNLETASLRIKRGIESSQKNKDNKKPTKETNKDSNKDPDMDDEDLDDEEDDDYEEDEAHPKVIKDYGDECHFTEECNWPLVCEETEHDDGSKTSSCSCDESYYYYDNVLSTCLLDGYDIIDYVKQLIEDLKNTTNNNKNDQEEKPKTTRQSQTNKKDLQNRNLLTNSTISRSSAETTEPPSGFKEEKLSIESTTAQQPIIIEKIVHKDDTMILLIVTAVLFVITWIFVIVFIRRLENAIDRKLGDHRRFSDNKL